MNELEATVNMDKVQRGLLLTGGVASIGAIVGAVLNPTQFFHSYLFSFLFWLGITLGSMAVLMLHHLVGGLWGFVIQRVLETASRLLPFMAVLFIPVLIGIPYLYEWSHAEAAEDAALAFKSPYLNVPFFIGRAVFYFALWTLLAFLLNRWSRHLDDTGEAGMIRRMERLSGPGLVVYALTMSFAAFDWAMSLEPHWYSTIFGLVFLVGQGLSTISFAIIVTMLLANRKPLAEIISSKQFHDLGNLLLAFVMLWAYVAFSQFLIIWSGNIPEEATWYVHRLHGGWNVIALVLVVLHFGVPFLLLLLRASKKRAQVLASIAAGLLVLRLVDLFWIVQPALYREGFSIHWLDLLLPVALGGFWLAAFVWQLKRTSLVPLRDPRLIEALSYREAEL